MTKPLTRRRVSPAIVAKRDGTCRWCHGPIRAGVDYISKVAPESAPPFEEHPADRWMHNDATKTCATNYATAINDNLPDEDEAA